MSQASLWRGSFRFRSLIIVLAGTLGFFLGVAYLSVEDLKVEHILLVTGPSAFVPGEPAAVRVAALPRGGRGSLPVRVLSARIALEESAAEPLAVELDGRRPAVVRFTLPGAALERATLSLDIQAGDAEPRVLEVPLAVGTALVVEPVPPSALPREGEALRVSVQPEDGVLSYAMDNRVFVRVTDRSGAPVVAELTFEMGGGKVLRGLSDVLGLAAFEMDGGRPRYPVRVEARDGQGGEGSARADLVPVPRGQRLRLRPRVLPPGGEIRLELQTLEDKLSLHCDLVSGRRIVDSFFMESKGGSAATQRSAPREAGAYGFQCSTYYVSAGEAYASRRFVVAAPGADELAPLAAAVAPSDEADRLWLAGLAARAGALERLEQERAGDYLAARLQPGFVGSSRLLSTLSTDEAALAHRREGLKGKLLTALTVALSVLFVWAVGVVGSNIVDVRRRATVLREAVDGADEPADDDPELAAFRSPRDLGRGLGIAHYLVFAILAVMNLAALVWLLDLVG